MPSLDKILNTAFNAVGSAIPGSIHSASMTYETQGAYDTDTGAYAVTTSTVTGRVLVETEKPSTSIFPDYERGPGDDLLLLEGFTTRPKDGYEITANGRTWVVRRSQDILASGTGFYVIGRQKP